MYDLPTADYTHCNVLLSNSLNMKWTWLANRSECIHGLRPLKRGSLFFMTWSSDSTPCASTASVSGCGSFERSYRVLYFTSWAAGEVFLWGTTQVICIWNSFALPPFFCLSLFLCLHGPGLMLSSLSRPGLCAPVDYRHICTCTHTCIAFLLLRCPAVDWRKLHNVAEPVV